MSLNVLQEGIPSAKLENDRLCIPNWKGIPKGPVGGIALIRLITETGGLNPEHLANSSKLGGFVGS